MRLIDTHAHLQFPYEELGDNWTKPEPGTLELISGVVSRARDAGVVKMLNVGTSLEDSAHVNEISENFSNVFKVFGVHPHNAKELLSDEGKKSFEKLLEQGCPVAIGEIGLDFYKMQNSKDDQFVAFEYQLKLAKEKNLPVCIHTRDAFPETHELLKRYGSRGLIHSFTGDYDWAMKFIDLGFLIAFNGIVTFKNSKALQEAASKIPLEKMVLETDSPFLSPEPERGKINEPAKVRFTAQKIAELRGITAEEVGEMTSANVENLFGI
jgi:TatD DNase family protein